MSVPRSIDRTDIGAGPVTLVTNAETVVMVGPMLQTPKDTSFIVVWGTIQLTPGTSATGANVRVRLGTTVTGTQVGQNQGQSGITPAANGTLSFMVSFAAAFTDYVQVCVTVAQVGATGNGTVVGGVMVTQSW